MRKGFIRNPFYTKPKKGLEFVANYRTLFCFQCTLCNQPSMRYFKFNVSIGLSIHCYMWVCNCNDQSLWFFCFHFNIQIFIINRLDCILIHDINWYKPSSNISLWTILFSSLVIFFLFHIRHLLSVKIHLIIISSSG